MHDVLLESFRPGVLDRLGVGYERLREENPGSSTARSPATGRTGPTATARGTTSNYLARGGLLGLSGSAAARRCRPPGRSPTSAAAR